MSDEIYARRDTKAPHPDGPYPAVCVDVIDLGESVDNYQGTISILPKVAIVFQTATEDPDNGKPLDIHIEVTLSFGRKAKLRKLLESWRGKPYSDAEAMAGVPLHKLEKQNGIVNVIHKTSAVSGNTYAVIDSIMPPMKGQARVEPIGYVRAEFWAKKKQQYADAVAAHRKQQGNDDERELAASPLGFDNDLPF